MSGCRNLSGAFPATDGSGCQEARGPRVSMDESPGARPCRPIRRMGASLDGSALCGTPRGIGRLSARLPRVAASPRAAPSPRLSRELTRPAELDAAIVEEASRLGEIPLRQIMEVPRRAMGRGNAAGKESAMLARTRSAPAEAFAQPRYEAQSLEGNIISAAQISGERARPENAFAAAYEVGDKLGVGTYGEVFKATERATGRQVAVKTINMRGVRCSPQRVALEVAMLKRLTDNKMVAQFYDTVEEGDKLHIVMELCSGGDLRDYVKDNGPLNESQAAMVAHQVLLLLREFHEARIVHGDVKPANFVIANKLSYQLFKRGMNFLPRGWLKAVDFGCSQNCGKGRIQQKLGTPSHWAPEVFGQTYHLEADVWSTGVLVYELLAGRLPFFTKKEEHRMRSERDILKALMFKEADFGCEELKGVSPECLDFLKQLLVKNHNHRMTVEQALEHKWMKNHVRAHKSAEKEVVEGLLKRQNWGVPVAC
ncbi:unnamed protein product [Ostreobium quekettii]|uniref:Protein kinase domain-containing protein n=1 Tax=Ostreobium quekettii TaxID=121088 RepID=A0A8S1J295_9CHLO|nr:unnamed protein product [Ostreobium quekettii]